MLTNIKIIRIKPVVLCGDILEELGDHGLA